MLIGLIPLSAKPYHIGHHAMVEDAASRCDVAILVVSLKDRKRKGEFPIYGTDMALIWRDHLEKVMPNNVRVVYTIDKSPVKKVYEILGNSEETKQSTKFQIFSGFEDVNNNFPDEQIQKNFPYLMQNALVEKVGVPRHFGISGTKMRDYCSERNFRDFASNLPPHCDALSIWNILQLGSKRA
jgi:hypothetical protein